MEIIKDLVYVDYRDSIIVDKNNSILAFKANRDRFTTSRQKEYAGLPQIGSKTSEDAKTWHCFRSMQKKNDFKPFSSLLGYNIENPEILLWTLSFTESADELQYICGKKIRTIDGIYKGQVTEPDVIIKTKTHLFIIECKLGVKDEYPNHLWSCDPLSKGPELRKPIYFENNLFIGDSGYNSSSYQLYRMAYYADSIATELCVKPVLISLTNKTWWTRTRYEISPADIWNDFEKQINKDRLEIKNVFWQDIKENGSLNEYLLNHPCLF